MKLAAIATICVLFAANTALADSCPDLMDEFKEVTAEASDNEDLPLALWWAIQGEAAYEAGDDDECVEKVEEAIELLSDS